MEVVATGLASEPYTIQALMLVLYRHWHYAGFLHSWSSKSFLQMDLMESSNFNPPIILLQTVMEEVRHRSLPLYNRLKALVKSEDKRIWVFYNEYRS